MRNLTKLVVRDPDRKSKDSPASQCSIACWDVPETSTTLLKLSELRVDGGNLSGTQLQQLFDILLSSENIRKVGLPEARLKNRVSPEQILAVSKVVVLQCCIDYNRMQKIRVINVLFILSVSVLQKLVWIDLTQAKLDKDQV